MITAQSIEHLPLDALEPYARNSRTHSDAQVAQIAASILEFGFTNPVLIDGEGGIIAGHGRVMAARKVGIPEVPCIRLGHLTEAQRRAYVIADNKLALNAGWDFDLLTEELQALQAEDYDLSLLGFGDDELAALLEEKTDGLTDPEETPEPPADPVSALGDVWVLGRHRIVCGDNSDARTIDLLMAGRLVDLIVTSPPYNQRIDTFKPSGMHKEGDWSAKVGRLAYADSLPEREYQDQQRKMLDLWHGIMRDGASLFYNHKNRYRDKRVVTPWQWLPGPFAMRQEIIWKRPGSVTQNARMFLPCDERIFWMFKGDDFAFDDTTEIKTWSSVWEIAPKTNKDHPVAFPIDIPLRCVRACSIADDAVVDPYCGSGTTIIACEMTKRCGHAVEMNPSFVDVSVKRWQDFTGQQATLEGDGRTFAEIAAERNK